MPRGWGAGGGGAARAALRHGGVDAHVRRLGAAQLVLVVHCDDAVALGAVGRRARSWQGARSGEAGRRGVSRGVGGTGSCGGGQQRAPCEVAS